MELDARCRVKKASEEAGLIFGLPAAELVGEPIQKVRALVGGGRECGLRWLTVLQRASMPTI